MSARYVVKIGERYFCCESCKGTQTSVGPADQYGRTKAYAVAKRHGGRVVRLLSHDEAKRKAAAEALRALAVKLRGYADLHSNPNRADALRWTAKQAETEADALWPRKGG